MGLGTSLLLVAVGAVLRWAVSASTSGINLHTVGLILLIIGAVGFFISLFWMVSNADRWHTSPPNGPGSYPDSSPRPRV